MKPMFRNAAELGCRVNHSTSNYEGLAGVHSTESKLHKYDDETDKEVLCAEMISYRVNLNITPFFHSIFDAFDAP